MIKPTEITNFNRDNIQLQIFWIFCIVVAGKNSDHAASTVSKLLNDNINDHFEYFKSLGETGIRNSLIAAKTGQYDRISKAISQSLNLNLATCGFSDLKAIFGIGPKTAQFFLVHSRKDYEGVILDTHILKYLKSKGVEVPSSTPQNMEKYNKLSKKFLDISAKDYPLVSAAERDLIIWKKYSGRC